MGYQLVIHLTKAQQIFQMDSNCTIIYTNYPSNLKLVIITNTRFTHYPSKKTLHNIGKKQENKFFFNISTTLINNFMISNNKNISKISVKYVQGLSPL